MKSKIRVANPLAKTMEKDLEGLLRLFVIDPQEDCDCTTELYETSFESIVFLKEGKIERRQVDDRIILPMSENPLSQEELLNCIYASLPYAKEGPCEYDPSWILINPKTLVDTKLLAANEFEAWGHTLKGKFLNLIYRGSHVNMMALPNVQENMIYLIPEPEFFGCVTWNSTRFGAFAITDNVRKKELNANL